MEQQGSGQSSTRDRPPDWAAPPGRAAGAPRPASLVAALAAEMARRWQAGERPLVEEFLARHPQLADDADSVLDLITEELRLRRRHDAVVPVAEVIARFPR